MKKVILGMFASALILAPAASAQAAAHAVGTNVLGSDGTVYFIGTVGGLAPDADRSKFKIPYTSAGAFLSYKFNSWGKVVKANADDMALYNATWSPTGKDRYVMPRPGSLINDGGTVHIMTDYAKAGFVNEDVFYGLGYSYKWVANGDTSFLIQGSAINTTQCSHPVGSLVNDNGTYYIMLAVSKVGVPSIGVLDSWGYWTSDAVLANSYDRAAETTGTLSTRDSSLLTVLDTDFWTHDQDLEKADTTKYHMCGS